MTDTAILEDTYREAGERAAAKFLSGFTNRLAPPDTLRAFYTRADDPAVLVFVASTAGVKRDNLDLDIDGMTVDNYLKNPVFLWAHDYAGANLPIGRTLTLEKSDGKLTVKVRFDLDDRFAAEVYRKYRDGYLNAVSIGWDPVEWDDRRVTRSDLLDISAVPVPGDQDALIERAAEWARSFRADSPDGVSGSEDEKEPTLKDVVAMLNKAITLMQETHDEVMADKPDMKPDEDMPDDDDPSMTEIAAALNQKD